MHHRLLPERSLVRRSPRWTTGIGRGEDHGTGRGSFPGRILATAGARKTVGPVDNIDAESTTHSLGSALCGHRHRPGLLLLGCPGRGHTGHSRRSQETWHDQGADTPAQEDPVDATRRPEEAHAQDPRRPVAAVGPPALPPGTQAADPDQEPGPQDAPSAALPLV